MPPRITEDTFEYYVLDDLLAGLGYTILPGPEIAPGEPGAERDSFGQVILPGRLHQALARLNPELPPAALEEVVQKVATLPLASPSTTQNNRQFHRWLREGITLELPGPEGTIRYPIARLVDFDHPRQNDLAAVNQFTVIENKHNRRPDVVLFVNGLPLVLMELKDPKNPKADLRRALPRSRPTNKTSPRSSPITRSA